MLNLFTLRQASRRSWRIGQPKECRVFYMYYEDTMQERAMTLMGRKLSAAEALEGKFSSEGLAALVGEDESLELAMAKSLAAQANDVAAKAAWRMPDVQVLTPPARHVETKPIAAAPPKKLSVAEQLRALAAKTFLKK